MLRKRIGRLFASPGAGSGGDDGAAKASEPSSDRPLVRSTSFQPAPDRELASGSTPGAWLGVALLVFIFAWFFGELRTRTGWDDTYYLLQASSLAEDGDLDLRNDALHSTLAPRDLQRFLTATLPSGTLKNTFSIGPAVLWLPAYAAGMPWRAGAGTPAARRWSHGQLVALHLLSLAFLAGVAWSVLRLLELAGTEQKTALAATLAVLVGTPLAVYGPALYTMAHLPSAVATCLFVASVLWLERDPRPYRALLAGLALGLVFLVRWQDAVFGVLLWVPLAPLLGGALGPRRPAGVTGEARPGGGAPAAQLASAATGPRPAGERRRDLRRLVWVLGSLAAGVLAMASLQLHAWRVELGSWLTMPQGEDYMRWSQPHLRELLLSGYSGLLPWSPVFALAAAGLLLPWRCRLTPRWRVAALAVLAAQVYVNAAVRDWWGGDSFGPRRMASCVPLLAIGLANLAAAAAGSRLARRSLLALLAALCLWGGFTTSLYWSQVRDLSLLVRDAPFLAPPEAPQEGGGVTDPAVARERALHPNFDRPHDDFTGFRGLRPAAGTWLTAALMAGAVAGTCLALSRAPGRQALQAALLALLGIVLCCHLLLALGPRPDRGERAVWHGVAAPWTDPGHPAAALAASAAPAEAEADRLDAAAAPPVACRGRRTTSVAVRHLPEESPCWSRGAAAVRSSPADAYRYLAMLARWEGDEPRRALPLLAGLAARGYPVAAGLRQRAAALAPGGEVLRVLPGACFTPLPGAAFRVLSVPAGDGGGPVAWEAVFDLRLIDLEPGLLYDVAAFQDRRRGELVRVSLRGEGAVELATPLATAAARLDLGHRLLYHLRLRYDLLAGKAGLEVSGETVPPARLVAPLAAGSPPPDRLLLGRSRKGHASFPLWSATFSELWLTAVNR